MADGGAPRARFMLFGWWHYEACGGSGDVRGRFATIDEARDAAARENDDAWQILDLDTGEWVDGKTED